MRVFLLSVLMIIFTHSAEAQNTELSPELLKDMMNNVSAEYAKCAAYFTHASAAMANSGEQETAERYSQFSQEVLTLAHAAAGTGRSEDMALKVVVSNYEIMTEEMVREIEKDYSNFSVLFAKYAHRCDFIINDTEAFLAEWKTKTLLDSFDSH